MQTVRSKDYGEYQKQFLQKLEISESKPNENEVMMQKEKRKDPNLDILAYSSSKQRMAQYSTNNITAERMLDNLSNIIKRKRKDESNQSRRGLGQALDQIQDVTQIIPDESPYASTSPEAIANVKEVLQMR